MLCVLCRRQEIDLRIGASFTRMQTLLLRDRFDWSSQQGLNAKVISYGPCQFPTLGLIVQRAWEIDSHFSEPFWYISLLYRSTPDQHPPSSEAAGPSDGERTGGQGQGQGVMSCDFTWTRGRLFDQDIAQLLFRQCTLPDPPGPIAKVISVEGSRKMKPPPFPLSTLEMQKKATQYLRLAGDQIMKLVRSACP